MSGQSDKKVAMKTFLESDSDDGQRKRDRLEAQRAKLYGHLAPFDGDTTIVVFDDDLAQKYIGGDNAMVHIVMEAVFKFGIRHLEKEGNDLVIIRSNRHTIEMAYSAREAYLEKTEDGRDIISVMTDVVTRKIAESIRKQSETPQNTGVETNVNIYRGVKMSLSYFISRHRLPRSTIGQRILFITGSDLPGDTSFIKLRRMIESAKKRDIVIDVYNIGGSIQPHLLRASSTTGGFYKRLSGKKDDLNFV